MSRVAVDLFAGAGGATQGLRDAGFDVRVAVELEIDAATTWSRNHPGVMLQSDVRDVEPETILSAAAVRKGELDLLKACPPCQGFSSLRGKTAPDDVRNDLVLDTVRFVSGLMPKAVLIENVPGLRRDWRFESLTDSLRLLGYGLRDYLIDASKLGVPQRRRRLVLIAVRGAEALTDFEDLVPSSGRRPPMTAGEALTGISALIENDPIHIWRKSSRLVAERIAAVPMGGTRFDLPESLQLDCHKRMISEAGSVRKSAAGSYGRVKADKAAPTMTTRCTTPACGSFIHPTENRGISLREAATFQTFPPSYNWAGTYGSIERQIGNAVPVWMAETLGKVVDKLLLESQKVGVPYGSAS